MQEMNFFNHEMCNGFTVTDSMYNDKDYNGSESKFGITVSGKDYIVKFQKKDWLNVYSEVIASNFIRAAGWKSHETYLAKYVNSDVAVCKDFTNEVGKLKSLSSLSSSSIDTDPVNHAYYFRDVIYELSKVHDLDIKEATHDFWMMYLFDTILGNTDRHAGNWGICFKDGVYKISPIYDNGATLFPRNHKFNIDDDWMRERIFVFPNSKIMFRNKREKSSYYDVWQSGMIPKNIREFAEDLDVVNSARQAIEGLGLSDLQQSYYVSIIYYRWLGIIKNEYSWGGMI